MMSRLSIDLRSKDAIRHQPDDGWRHLNKILAAVDYHLAEDFQIRTSWTTRYEASSDPPSQRKDGIAFVVL